MKDWQFTVIFIVGIVGTLVMLFADPLGLEIDTAVVTLFGVMMSFIYQQKKHSKDDKEVDGDV